MNETISYNSDIYESTQFEPEVLQLELDSVFCCQCKKSLLTEYLKTQNNENDFNYFYLENIINKQTKILLLCSNCSKEVSKINQKEYIPIIRILEDQLSKGLIYINLFDNPEIADKEKYKVLLSLKETPQQKIFFSGTLRKGYMFCQQCLGAVTHLELFEQLLIKCASKNGHTSLFLAQKMAEQQYLLDKEQFEIYSAKLKDSSTSVKEKIYLTQKLKILCERYQSQPQIIELDDIKIRK